MAASDKELELMLMEAGNRLVEPPSSVDELIPLLDQVESCLARVEQSPSQSMQNALSPSLKALVAEKLFRHPDDDVKVAVASCISEITRITAPEAPYDDDQMKEVFQLIVSSFENLSDKSSRSFTKRTSILETVAKVRSCVVMLDLECDALIIEMFQHFLKAIRDYHAEGVFTSMLTIMTLVLEESEDVSVELLSPVLASVKKDNEEVLPIARRLAERVLEDCASKLKPYLKQAVESLGNSFDDYSSVVASICQVTPVAVEQNDAATDKHVDDESKQAEASLSDAAQEDKEPPKAAASDEQVDHANVKSSKSVVSNGILQTAEDDSLAASAPLKKQEDDEQEDDKQKDDKQEDDKQKDDKQEDDKQEDDKQEDDKQEDDKQEDEKQEDDHLADKSKSADTSTVAEPDRLETEKLADSDSKSEQSAQEKGRKSDLKSAEPSNSSHVDEKEAETLTDHKNDKKDDAGAPSEDPSLDGWAKSSENKGETDVQPSSPKATEDADVSSENKKETDVQPSSLKATEDESTGVASPTASGTIPEDVQSKRAARSKRKDTAASVEEVSKKSSEGTRDSEAKTNRRSGKKVATVVSNEDNVPANVDETKKESGLASDSEAKTNRRSGKKVATVVSNEDNLPTNVDETKKESGTASDSEAKTNRRSGKKVATVISNEDNVPANVDETKKESGTASDSEAKSLKPASKKVDASSNNADGSSSKQLEDKKKRARGKPVAEKDGTKTSTKKDDEEMVSSPKSVKPNKEDSRVEETPKPSSKRKHSFIKEKASGSLEYGENLIGLKVQVWWPKDKAFYEGFIESFDSARKKHKVHYNDGDEEILNLKRERWEIIEDLGSDEDEATDLPTHDSSSETPLKKKEKAVDHPSKKAKTDASPKRVGGTSSAKSKGAVAKSGSKTKEGNKVDGKSKDGSKGASKSENDTKAKDTTGKSGSKSVDAASKGVNKSKNEDSGDTPKSTKTKDDTSVTPKASTKSKQETPKVSSNSKSKPGKSGGKSNANGTGKSKAGSSKVKESESTKENSTDSAKAAESAKRKSPSSSKARGSDSKSAKKRRR
ncbi:hypothetical protein COLO4_03454 [Corchorus olitorius]|uniref:Tudor domain-containing protein n=1 Tax=Corchorus olitorius TaxID=93759 RepID=A0A1R3KYN3_9ROSI|nr:hypothetical protein COLO4_03454 [Corchorus olitorius]